MILKASQRGGSMQLGAHLLKRENEHVSVHEIRGFASDDLMGAMKEAQAVAKGTRCKQHLFSVSLNPPESASVGMDAFESAIDRIEQANGLTDQPRIVVFHEKQGRRHAHAVWSRIDADTMTARPLPFFKAKLRDLSRALYLERGWSLPRGLMNSKERDPRNFTHAEWQQAKRMGHDPKAIKTAMRECWSISDTREAFAAALERRGLYLARGDSRAYVALTYEGAALSVSRQLGVRAKDVAARLGDVADMRGVDETRAYIADTIAPRLEALLRIAKTAHAREMKPLDERRTLMRECHSVERQKMAQGQRLRFEAESRQRSERFRSGVAGLWDRLSGRHADISRENERDAFNAFRRDRGQRDALIRDQLNERRGLQREIVAVRQRHAARTLDLHKDITRLHSGSERGQSRSSAREASRGTGRGGPRLGM